MRCYLPPGQWTEGDIAVSGEEAHYLRDVLRVRPGQAVELFDGEGRIATAVVASVARHDVVLRAGPAQRRPAPAPVIHLVQALPKAAKMDRIVRAAAELGAGWIHPVRTRHAVARPDEGRGQRKGEHWQSVALAAARQCGAAHVCRVGPVTALGEWLEDPGRPPVMLVGDLRPGAEPARRALEPLRQRPPDALAVVIGPEGDLAADELDALGAAGAVFVNLGPTTLRTETAAIYALSILRYTLRP